ncbi:hypothetical protein GCM10011571_03480 [Marinithermofilum abyssi]|uniref:Uncharacterized protein n=1 Tax=Marinithermofilum abyssi TaxID=1571185 RepID=A0A8J2VG30_9BACL|nr:hypothetical protein [Marinithermofilum abyssi]GGE05672.1 hypothetical protein GCM10011571_03480 [Marinithermofilum abyssi]
MWKKFASVGMAAALTVGVSVSLPTVSHAAVTDTVNDVKYQVENTAGSVPVNTGDVQSAPQTVKDTVQGKVSVAKAEATDKVETVKDKVGTVGEPSTVEANDVKNKAEKAAGKLDVQNADEKVHSTAHKAVNKVHKTAHKAEQKVNGTKYQAETAVSNAKWQGENTLSQFFSLEGLKDKVASFLNNFS